MTTAAMNVVHLLANAVANRSCDIALVDGANRSRRTTFGELDLVARRMSARLRSDGLRAGDHALL